MSLCPDCGCDHDDGRVLIYNIDKALKEMARARVRRDPVTQGQVAIGDKLAGYMIHHFSPEELETAGRALIVGAASIATLTLADLPPAILCNVLGFAGARMVQDGRAWEPDGMEVTP